MLAVGRGHVHVDRATGAGFDQQPQIIVGVFGQHPGGGDSGGQHGVGLLDAEAVAEQVVAADDDAAVGMVFAGHVALAVVGGGIARLRHEHGMTAATGRSARHRATDVC